MKFKFLILVLLTGIVKSNYAQNTVNADVVAVIQQGTYSYAIISETGTSNLYQTSAYYATQGYLTTSQQIQLSFDDLTDKTQGEVFASTVNNVICFLNTASSNNTSNITITLPYVSNGILFFEDQEHIVEVHDWIEYIIDSSSVEMSEALDLLESQFTGFSSFRTKLDLQFGISQNGFTDQELDEYLEIDFIKDEILKTFVNENRMIGIDDSVFFMKGENMILGIDANDINLISGIAALPDSIEVFGPGGVIDLAGNPHEITIFSPFYHIPDVGNYAFIQVDEELAYETFPVLDNFNCETYKKAIKVNIVETYDDGTDEDISFYDMGEVGTLTIDWGDDVVQVISGYKGEWIEHSYAALGTYYPETKLEFLDRYEEPQELIDNVDEDPDMKFEVAIACTRADASAVEYATSGSYRMVSQVFVQDNVVCRQIGAITTFYEYSGGTWKEEKADLYAKVNGVFRDYNCSVQETKSETKLRRLRRSIQADKTKFWRYYDVANGDIVSRHYCVKGALFLEVNLVLNPC